MESNKLFAAILVAGILAMLSGFVAKKVIHVEAPEEDAYKIEAAAGDEGAGAATEAVAEPILALLASADAAKGENTGKACAACHTFKKGEPARVGPNLWGIVGSNHAHMDGFAYSDAMKALHGEKWDYKSLNAFLWNPKKHVPGTKMVFAGIKKPQDRANVIAWLRSLSDSPAALPSESDISAEATVTEDKAEAAEDAAKETAEEKAEDNTKPAETQAPSPKPEAAETH